MSHWFSIDRSRSKQEYLRNLRRLTRFKTRVLNHLDDVQKLELEFRRLPACLCEQDLARAVNGAMVNSFALGQRVESWQIEKGETGVGGLFGEFEAYLERCVTVVEGLLEHVRGLRALVGEEEEQKEEEEGEGTEEGEAEEEVV